MEIVVAIVLLVLVAAVISLAYAVWKDSKRRDTLHEQQMDRLVRQIVRQNPANAALDAMKTTAETITTSLDKVIGTIGKSFADAGGYTSGGVVEPQGDTDVRQLYEQDTEAIRFPDVEMDGRFVPIGALNGDGWISTVPTGADGGPPSDG